MGIGALVKRVKGAIARPASQRVVNAQFVDLGRGRNSSNTSNGNGSAGGGIRAISLSPEAGALIQNYYGIDLASIPNMSPEQMGEFVDFLRQSEWMDKYLSVLKEHINKYIARQISFNQFVADVTKTGIKGAEAIDKATLDTYLAVKGYTNNTQKLSQKASVEEKRLDQDLANYIDLEEYSLNASLVVMAAKLEAKKKEIDARPEKAEEQAQIAAERRAEEERIKNLITYGTRPIAVMGSASGEPITTTTNMGNNNGGGNRGGRGFVNRLTNFFQGR
jgi:hypothetical protein